MDSLSIETTREQLAISLEPYHTWTVVNESDWCRFYHIDDHYLLRFPELADFKIDTQNSKVTCWPAPNAAIATIKQLYLNQVVPLVQSHSSKLVFHGSAIVFEDLAIAFVGVSGRGKSTLAASFSSNGYPFLTEDGLLIKQIGDTYHVAPSHASIRLWDDSQLAILGEAAVSEVPLDYTTKLRFPANDNMLHHQKLSKLHRIYFLSDVDCSQVKFTKLSHQRALVELIQNSFLLDIEDKKMLATHFDQLSKMSSLGIFYQIDYPRDFTELANVRQTILRHAALSGKTATKK